MIPLGGFEEVLWVFTGETANAKAKSSENFLSPDKIGQFFVVLGGLRVRWYKKFQFLPQRAHPC